MATILDEKREPLVEGKLVLGGLSSHIEFFPATPPNETVVTQKAKRVLVDPGVEFSIARIVALNGPSAPPHFQLDIEL